MEDQSRGRRSCTPATCGSDSVAASLASCCACDGKSGSNPASNIAFRPRSRKNSEEGSIVVPYQALTPRPLSQFWERGRRKDSAALLTKEGWRGAIARAFPTQRSCLYV